MIMSLLLLLLLGGNARPKIATASQYVSRFSQNMHAAVVTVSILLGSNSVFGQDSQNGDLFLPSDPLELYMVSLSCFRRHQNRSTTTTIFPVSLHVALIYYSAGGLSDRAISSVSRPCAAAHQLATLLPLSSLMAAPSTSAGRRRGEAKRSCNMQFIN